jgi:predicted ATPase/transcriptional regulator with XRE-family HTH domain
VGRVTTSFAEQLRRYRTRAALSQDELAERAGLATSAVSQLERGARQRPRSHTVRALADALGLTDDERAALLALASSAGPARLDAPVAPALPPDPGSATDSTPAAPPRAPLPAPLTSFLGREHDLAAAVQLLSGGTRLLTLTGPGGGGKTRLALALASRVEERYPDGVSFIDLSSVTDAAHVPAVIAQALEVQVGAERSITSALVRYLSDRSASGGLLVLDNFEQVIEAAPLLHGLLVDCPGLTLLVTSRELLRLSGEREYPVPPLALPTSEQVGEGDLESLAAAPAVALFVERAQAVKTDFTLTEANARTVAAICAHLDGLPLALELAAARVRILSPRALLARLEHRLDLLTGGARDLPARQQTLEATIAWSHNLLNEPEQRLFRRLAVFAGGWTLEAAEAIAGSGNRDPAVLDLLTGLVDKSLVVAEPSAGVVRYRLLESIRAYAAGRLDDSGEAGEMRERHRRWYLALAEAAAPHWHGPDDQHWLALMEVERDNLRAALAAGGPAQARLCLALRRFWEGRYYGEARFWLDAVLAADLDLTDELRVALLSWAGVMVGDLGEVEQARAHLNEALALARRLGDPTEIATALNNLGVMAFRQADYDAAQALHEEGLSLERAHSRPTGIASALHNLGNVAYRRGDHATARSRYEEALALRRGQGDQADVAGLVNNLGNVAVAEGDLVAAQALYEQALQVCREIGNQAGVAGALHNLGNVAFHRHDTATARAHYEEALALRRTLGTPIGVCRSLANLAAVAFAEGNTTEARMLLDESLVLAREFSVDLKIASVLDSATERPASGPVTGERVLLPLEQATSEALEAAVPDPHLTAVYARATATPAAARHTPGGRR